MYGWSPRAQVLWFMYGMVNWQCIMKHLYIVILWTGRTRLCNGLLLKWKQFGFFMFWKCMVYGFGYVTWKYDCIGLTWLKKAYNEHGQEVYNRVMVSIWLISEPRMDYGRKERGTRVWDETNRCVDFGQSWRKSTFGQHVIFFVNFHVRGTCNDL